MVIPISSNLTSILVSKLLILFISILFVLIIYTPLLLIGLVQHIVNDIFTSLILVHLDTDYFKMF